MTLKFYPIVGIVLVGITVAALVSVYNTGVDHGLAKAAEEQAELLAEAIRQNDEYRLAQRAQAVADVVAAAKRTIEIENQARNATVRIANERDESDCLDTPGNPAVVRVLNKTLTGGDTMPGAESRTTGSDTSYAPTNRDAFLACNDCGRAYRRCAQQLNRLIKEVTP